MKTISEKLQRFWTLILLLLPKQSKEQFSSWDKAFMKVALTWSERSKDPSSQVGAVIAKGKDFISPGFNGFAKGVRDLPERLANRDIKYPLTLHAELNAILFAKQDLTGCTIYSTHPPCERCAAVICQSGIKRVVYLEPSEEFKSRWNMMWVKVQFHEAGVTMESMDGRLLH